MEKAATYLPLAAVDKCVGGNVLVLMRGEREFTGKLNGFDDYMNLVLEDAQELTFIPTLDGASYEPILRKTGTILLNGNSIDLEDSLSC